MKIKVCINITWPAHFYQSVISLKDRELSNVTDRYAVVLL